MLWSNWSTVYPLKFTTHLVGGGGNITGWGEFKASDGLGVGCYTGDIYKIKPVDDTATTACVYPS